MELFMRMLRNIGLGLLVLVLILIFFNNIFKQAPAVMDDVECGQEITEYLQLRKLSDTLAPPPECPTQIIPVETDDKEEVKAVMAEAARSCFRTWREGNESFFAGEGTFCHICSLIELDQELEIKDFNDYLQKKYIPGTETPYGHYFSKKLLIDDNDVYNEGFSDAFQLDSFTIDNPVSVLFIQSRGKDNIKKTTDALGKNGSDWRFVLGLLEFTQDLDTSGGIKSFIGGGLLAPNSPLKIFGIGILASIDDDDLHIIPEEFTAISIQSYTPDSLAQLGCQLPSKSLS